MFSRAWLLGLWLPLGCGAKPFADLGNMLTADAEVKHGDDCFGMTRCMKVCTEAEKNPKLGPDCEKAKADVKNAKPTPPGPSAEEDFSKVPAQLGPGAFRSHDPLPPAGLFVRSAAAVVVVRTGDAQGSGFAVHGAGLIVTNLHVVRGAKQVEVVMYDGRRLVVTRIEGYSETHDLAVLRVRERLNTLALAEDDDVIPGERIVAIGNPLGLQLTISDGIVGGLREKNDSTEVVQITTPISPGSSGGPILNQWGEVIGVATFKFMEGEALNFAMPTRYVHLLLRHLSPVTLAAFAQATERPEPKPAPAPKASAAP